MRLLILTYLLCITSSIYTKDIQIKKIEINGLHNHSAKQIERYITEQYSISTMLLFDKLASLKIFSKIKVVAQEKKLTVTLQEYPIIEDIHIYGDDNETIYNILKTNNITVYHVFNPGNLQFFKKNIEAYYHEQGLFNFNLNIKLNLNKKTNKVRLRINFKKNDFFTIKKIYAYGIKSEAGKELLDAVIIKNTSWLPNVDNKDILSMQNIKGDLQFLKENYLFHGYMDFNIKSGKIIIDKNKHNIFILLDIHEGRQYKIKENVINDKTGKHNFNATLKEIMSDTFKKGDKFDGNLLNILQKKIEMYFHYKGFIETKPKIEPLMTGENLVDLVLSFKKTIRTKIDEIHIKGNQKVTDMLLRKLTKQMTESYCKTYYLDLVKRDLIKFNHVKQFKYTFERNEDKAESDFNIAKLILDVKEKNLNKFIAGANYQSNLGFSGHVSTEVSNFLGSGSDFTVKISRSKRMIEFQIGGIVQDYFTHEGELIYSLYYKTNTFHKKKDEDKTKREYGFLISKSINLNDYSKLTLQFACDKAFYALPPFRTTMFVQEYSDKWNVKHVEENITLLHTYNTLDFPEQPSDGILSKITLKLQLPTSEVKYYIFNWELDLYKELHEAFIFHVNFNFIHGNVYSYNDDEVEFPFFRNFQFIGRANIRGYKDRSIGPKDLFFQPLGGNTLFSVKTSLYFPIPYIYDIYIPNLKSSIFFDAGQVYNTHEYPDEPLWMEEDRDYSSFVRCSIGLQLYWQTPLGLPVEITFSHALNPNEIEETENITISFIKIPAI